MCVSVKPNIVIFLLDAVRPDHLSCYGYDRETTPFLEQLTADATRYERAYSSSIWTLPSYGALFTGLYPSQHGAVDWNARITDPTFVDALNEAGYTTHTTSAHLGGAEEFGIADSFQTREEVTIRTRDFLFPDDPVFEEMEDRRKSDTYESTARRYAAAAKLAIKERSWKSFPNALYHQYQLFRRRNGLWTDNGAKKLCDRGVSFLEDADSPFCLFVDFLEAHQPYRPPRGYIRRFLPSDVSIEEMNAVIDANHVGRTIRGDSFSSREREILVGLYDASIRYLDDRLRSFYQRLESIGLRDETVCIILSDHGDLFGEWGLWGHQGRIHNSLCHTPLIIDYPWSSGGQVSEITELRQLGDHLATLAEGVDPADGPRLTPRGEALAEYYGLDTQVSITPWDAYDDATRRNWGQYQTSLFSDRYHLYWDASGRTELYDIIADPAETEPIDDPETTDRLRERIETLVGHPNENHQAYRQRSTTDTFDVADRASDHLEDLGYL